MIRADKLAGILNSIAGMAIVAVLLVQIVVVTFRYVFALGWSWTLDLLVYLFFISVLLPGLSVLIRNLSVRVDIFHTRWGQKWQTLIDRLALLCFLFPAMAFAAWASLPATIGAWQVLEASPTYGGLPGYFLLKTCLSLFFAKLAVIALILGLRKSPYELPRG